MREISSRDNPLLQRVRRLQRQPLAYRELGLCWIEGAHLCEAQARSGAVARHAIVAESAWADPALHDLAQRAAEVVRLPDRLFETLSSLPSPAGLGFVIDLPAAAAIAPLAQTLVLDRLQDPGNVGSILRSAAAFGVAQVLALEGTVGLWTPKVLRSAMGAHFGRLRLHERVAETALAALDVPLLATSSHAGAVLGQAPLPHPAAWVLGHEGQGISPALLARCAMTLRISQPGGEESLNVAAAAAVCLYESARARSQ